MIPSTHPNGQQQQQPGGVQHDQGEGYKKPITFSRVRQSGKVEIKIEYCYPIPNT